MDPAFGGESSRAAGVRRSIIERWKAGERSKGKPLISGRFGGWRVWQWVGHEHRLLAGAQYFFRGPGGAERECRLRRRTSRRGLTGDVHAPAARRFGSVHGGCRPAVRSLRSESAQWFIRVGGAFRGKRFRDWRCAGAKIRQRTADHPIPRARDRVPALWLG